MITQERKSKFKHKISMPRDANAWHSAAILNHDMRSWCEERFGPSGRRNRWRFGWTDKITTFYFRQGKDATMFTLRWAS